MKRDEDVLELLKGVRTIAVVGIKDGESEDAFRVPRYLQAAGYRILPVNPKLAEVLGERAVPSLSDLDEPIDLVNVFRAPHFVAGHAEEVLALSPRPRAVWLQLGIRDDAAARSLREAGIAVVQDRCLMVEHGRLLRGAGPGPS